METTVILRDLPTTAVLTLYVTVVILLLKKTHQALVKRGWREDQASYLTRKLVHLLAAGPVTLALPHLYQNPIAPALVSMSMGLLLWARKRRGRVMSWFQTRDNNNEITFMIAWGAGILALWKLTGSMWLSVLPAAYISLGDGVTGIVRIAVLGRREKHWSGNIAMFTVTLPLSMAVAGLPGALSALASSLAEKLQVRYLDDNITITLVSVLILGAYFA